MARDSQAAHPLATPWPLKGLLDYQEGSVVSRTLVKTSGGTLTLFAFDAGEGLSEHSSPHDAVVQILEGRAKITVGGEPYTLESGEALLLPSSIPHSVHAEERFKMLLVMIRHPA